MPTFGKLDEYYETEDWRHDIERVNHFFEANEITDPGKRRSIFLVCVGAKTYKLVRSLVAPEDPKDKSYEDLAKLLQDHFISVLGCLGHQVDAEGFHPVEAKVNAIQEAPAPKNSTELKSILGMLNSYGKFIPNLSSILEPLRSLLRKDVVRKCEVEQPEAFDKAKTQLQPSDVLVHYDPEKELVVSCDASPYGVCAVVDHVIKDGSERPVAYASRTLSTAERNYGHLDKEVLAVGFAVKKFHQFLYGRLFKIYTDHKPLLGLLHPEKATPLMASSRMQRWALTLLAYEYELLYCPEN